MISTKRARAATVIGALGLAAAIAAIAQQAPPPKSTAAEAGSQGVAALAGHHDRH